MKKTIFLFCLVCSLVASAQKKEVADSLKNFALIMPQKNWVGLIDLIKTADEKPSIIKAWIDMFIANLKEVQQEKIKEK